MPEAVIVATARSPIGRAFKGSLVDARPDDLSAQMVEAVLAKVPQLPVEEIELLGPNGSARIDTLVRDIVDRSAEAGDIVQSEEVGGAMLRLRKFMFERVYLGTTARREHERVQRTMRGLFEHYSEHPEEVPSVDPEAEPCQRVADYIAGMTDRYCIAKFTALNVPEEARF